MSKIYQILYLVIPFYKNAKSMLKFYANILQKKGDFNTFSPSV